MKILPITSGEGNTNTTRRKKDSETQSMISTTEPIENMKIEETVNNFEMIPIDTTLMWNKEQINQIILSNGKYIYICQRMAPG